MICVAAGRVQAGFITLEELTRAELLRWNRVDTHGWEANFGKLAGASSKSTPEPDDQEDGTPKVVWLGRPIDFPSSCGTAGSSLTRSIGHGWLIGMAGGYEVLVLPSMRFVPIWEKVGSLPPHLFELIRPS